MVADIQKNHISANKLKKNAVSLINRKTPQPSYFTVEFVGLECFIERVIPENSLPFLRF